MSSPGLLINPKMLDYNLGDDHVMTTRRIFPAYYLFEELYLTTQVASPITLKDWNRDYLYRAHDHDYIDKFEELSLAGTGSALEFGLGIGDCPVWEGMADVSEFIIRSTLSNVNDILSDNVSSAFVLLGGLHHATRRRASGFCYYNDINVAIHYLKDNMAENNNILYIDTDLHHGDGVQFDFYYDSHVVTFSMHESGNYLFPGTGFPNEIGDGKGSGSKLNLPLFPYTWDKEYFSYFETIVPSLFEQVKPDFVIWQTGSDARVDDPLGHLQLTSSTYHKMGSMISDLAQATMTNPRVLALGGGGYHPFGNAKSWINSFAGLNSMPVPDKASLKWLHLMEENGLDVELDLRDKPSSPPIRDKSIIENGNANAFDELQKSISPHFTI